jgi:hypothetical protein
LPSEPQGEAIAFIPGSLSLYTLSEGAHQSLNHIVQHIVAGDINNDGTVNIDDLLAVIAMWEPCAGTCVADLDHNGTINIDDLLFVINHWS